MVRSGRILAAVVLAAVAAAGVTTPVQGATVRVVCQDCGDMPAWFLGLLAVVGIGLAMAILWLPQWLARGAPPRWRGLIVIGGLIVLTFGFVLGVRALVVALGGT